MKGVITVDIGTTSMRAVLYDADSHLIHMDQQENIPEYFNDGRVEQDASAWANILPVVLRNCATAAQAAVASRVATSSVSSFFSMARSLGC